jgi:hypothetical protein
MLSALLISLALSASGDIEAVLATPTAELDGPAKSTLATAILAIFPNAVTATIQQYYCRRDTANPDAAKRNDMVCSGVYANRVTTAKFVDLSIAGEVVKTIAGAPEGFVDIWQRAPTKVADTAGKAAQGTFVEQVFNGLTLTDINDFACQRDPNDDTKVSCRCSYFDTVSPGTYVTLAYAGYVLKPLRKIP